MANVLTEKVPFQKIPLSSYGQAYLSYLAWSTEHSWLKSMLLATSATHFSSKCLELNFYIRNCLHLGLQAASCLNAHVWEDEQAWAQTLRPHQEWV